MLKRKLAREKVCGALANRTDAQGRVSNAKYLAIEDTALPAVVVFTPSEFTQDGLLLITMEVQAFISADFDQEVGNVADDFCQQITDALARFWEASGDFTASYLGTEIETDLNGAQPIAAARISYQIECLNE